MTTLKKQPKATVVENYQAEVVEPKEGKISTKDLTRKGESQNQIKKVQTSCFGGEAVQIIQDNKTHLGASSN